MHKKLKERFDKNASHSNFIERKKGLLKHRADKATKVRDSFFPIMKVFSDEMLVAREPERFFFS